MKFPRILSLPLGLCFALCVNFSQAQTVDVSAPGDPVGSNNVNLGLVAPPPGGTFYKNAQVTADPATITVSDAFAPFGSRPTTDKTGEDGSVAFRDINGVLVWIDNKNRAVTIPNSSFAKTLYVSNSECVVWQNRYDATYNVLGSKSDVVIHRINTAGQVVSTTVTSIDGTLYDTAPVTRSPLGYTLLASRPLPDNADNQQFTLYRLTFDGKVQTVNNSAVNDLTAVDGDLLDNLAYSKVIATASDGSMLIQDGDLKALWVTWEPGAETWVYLDLGISTPIYLSKNRLLISDSVDIYEYTKNGNNVTLPAPVYTIPAGYDILQIDTYTEVNSQLFFYAMNGLDLQLLTIDAGTVAFVGAPVTLPATINTNLPRVRNLEDGSLLAITEGSQTVIWVTATVDFITGAINGLNTVTEIPLSTQGNPMYVTNDEVVVWMNARAPLDGSGNVAPALISHFEQSGGPLVTTDLTPPIIGGHVAAPPIFTPDPKSQGWFITTFERSSSVSAEIRTYRLQTIEATDSDGDGLFDWQEEALSTDLYNGDTDGDGLSDGQEVFPYYTISGSFNYEQAKSDALNRGGSLAVLETEIIRVGAARTIGSLATGNSYWLGGQGFLEPIPLFPNNRTYRWLYNGLVATANSVVASPPWATGFPTTTGGANSIAINSNYEWTVLAATKSNNYLLQFHGSNPRKPDSDLDGINDDDEYLNGTNPIIVDSFSGVPDLGSFLPIAVPFSNTAKGLATTYYGLVYDPEQGHIANMTMKVSKTGAFTYTYQGLTSAIKASGKGGFNGGTGAYFGAGPTGLSDIISVKMQYVDQSFDEWVVFGVMERVTGEQLGFELRRGKYNSKTNKYTTPGALTMAMPLADVVASEPLGEGVSTGNITTAGLVTLSIYQPDGGRSTYQGPILDKDLLALNSISTTNKKAALIGPVNMASTRASLHYDGNLRFFAQAALLNGQYTTAIDQQRTVLGSRYIPPSTGIAPISGIILGGWNTRYNLSNGDFDGISKIGAWDLKNKINIPGSPVNSSKAAFTVKTGLISFVYTQTDSFGAQTLANSFAVALQRPKQIRGFYTSAFSSGSFNVIKNDGTPPTLTSISPVNKTVPVTLNSYFVQVNTPGAWEVVIPPGQTVTVVTTVVTPADPVAGTPATTEEVESVIPWVSAEIVSGGVPDPVTGAIGLKGTGNGIVKITVQENTTGLWFYSTLTIAGIKHKITQQYSENR